ncbi:hypothetical protein BDFB_007708 [Asbolus verrucosus]|uniref:Uncharacterized protein n=1 Tax=Asbolus verrucosus TaxID=1661398 RepID=A0A482VZT1_ASBVE|nr:hypothetical protein BDFB_007708 [Asbolus verrucosus]
MTRTKSFNFVKTEATVRTMPSNRLFCRYWPRLQSFELCNIGVRRLFMITSTEYALLSMFN